MKVIDSSDALKEIGTGWVLSIGNFDGVHLGHRRIIGHARCVCEKISACGFAVMTFQPHPAVILHPEKAPAVLTPPVMKEKLLSRLGVDRLIVIKDSFRLLNLSPKDFVDEFLMKHIRPAAVVEGPNFNFGYGRSGSIDTLRQLGAERGFQVIEVPYAQVNIGNDRRNVVCSSSLVRRLIEKGDVADAAKALAGPYRLAGKVVAGRGVGTQIGFPTANIRPEEQIIPAEGVYAGFVRVADELEGVCGDEKGPAAVFSIGRAKTFMSEHPLLVETHILEPDVENLRDKYMTMDFIQRLRGQQRFENRQMLSRQIAEDCRQAKDILGRINRI